MGTVAEGATDSMTYFPGTLDFSRAQAVAVGFGATGGLDFKMMTGPRMAAVGAETFRRVRLS
jgi:hypothetical protein